MERQGQAQWKLGKFKDAKETWTAGKDLAKQFGYTDRASSILDHMIAMYRVSGMSREAAECAHEKAQLTAGAPHGA